MNPIQNEIGTVFIPVRDIVKSRDWYCDLLGITNDGEIHHGHLYVLPMKGTSIVLDSKIFAEDHIYKVPVFHLNTKDIQASYAYMKEKNVELVTGIEHGHWFNFKDPDGNLLMICMC
ncbi:VOC family protein [Paenibacillus qinlingensis]|uniref:VOC family protein n=1 Tax=Paenibacillus qinlingensis TaxID=1837343 RepID=UPI001566E641|nr:VOC family protein [Paenibacillus qinlingensis]NQX58437.1 VOC family protein [Paenibacillus qinlingensis]